MKENEDKIDWKKDELISIEGYIKFLECLHLNISDMSINRLKMLFDHATRSGLEELVQYKQWGQSSLHLSRLGGASGTLFGDIQRFERDMVMGGKALAKTLQRVKDREEQKYD